MEFRSFPAIPEDSREICALSQDYSVYSKGSETYIVSPGDIFHFSLPYAQVASSLKLWSAKDLGDFLRRASAHYVYLPRVIDTDAPALPAYDYHGAFYVSGTRGGYYRRSPAGSPQQTPLP